MRRDQLGVGAKGYEEERPADDSRDCGVQAGEGGADADGGSGGAAAGAHGHIGISGTVGAAHWIWTGEPSSGKADAGSDETDADADPGSGSRKFFYAALFLTEGLGLWFYKKWAEWMTIVLTSSLLPVEIWELIKHPNVVKVGVLVVNLLLVGYLIYLVRKERGVVE